MLNEREGWKDTVKGPCRYLIAMDPTLPEAETPQLPELPTNAEMVRPPACFENGVVGWLLYTSEQVALSDYRCSCLPPHTVGPLLPQRTKRPRRGMDSFHHGLSSQTTNFDCEVQIKHTIIAEPRESTS